MKISIAITGLALWFAGGCIVSYFAGKKREEGLFEYFIANRKLGGFITAMTYSATTYSSFMMVGLVGMAYSIGVGAFGFEITYLVSTILILTYLAPKFWEIGRHYNIISPSELLNRHYGGTFPGKLVTIISLVMLIPYMSVQFMGIGYLLEGLAGIPYYVGTLVALVIILTFTLWAGMRSVAWTDALQSLIMLVSSITLLFFIVKGRIGGFGNFYASLIENHSDLLSPSKMPYMKFLGLSFPWMFFAITNPQVSQRMFIARDRKSLRTMILGFGFFGLIYTLIVVNLGLAAKCFFSGVSKPDMVTAVLLKSVPVFLSLFVFLGIVAASVSTVNSIALTLSSMFIMDFVKQKYHQGKYGIMLGKLIIIILTIMAYLFSLKRIGLIVNLSVMSSSGLLATAPSFLGIFWKRSSRIGSISSILAGVLVSILLYSLGWFPLGIWPGVWTAIVSSTLFILFAFVRESDKIV